MASPFSPILVITGLSLVVALIAVGLGELFGPRHPTLKKSQPYESGMVPYGPGTRRISVRYYLVAVLFILFDIEIIFFLPWAVVLRDLGVAGLAEMVMFVGIILVGFVYAWKKGAIEWE